MHRRRTFLKNSLSLAVGLPFSGLMAGCRRRNSRELLPADENGVRLLRGFRSRIVARSREPVVSTSLFRWHPAPDGAATFPAGDGGWIYVSNSEVPGHNGGVSALRFSADGTLVDAYPILAGTSRNCAGGATPWGTWLSCEEIDNGLVYECDPFGIQAPRAWPALGRFNHEAVAVDPGDRRLYLTEDKPDGCLYRFTPSTMLFDRPELASGILEALVTDRTGFLAWQRLPDPEALHGTPTRYQLRTPMRFNGGEGIAYLDGRVIFATKGDNRIWEYGIGSTRLKILYDAASPILSGVDNVTTLYNHIVVAEDGGDMQIVMLDTTGHVWPLLQVEGHDMSEITGPAFDPALKRLYFSSQRGAGGVSESGITYEVSGDFAALLQPET
jgi:uncharacterized protein